MIKKVALTSINLCIPNTVSEITKSEIAIKKSKFPFFMEESNLKNEIDKVIISKKVATIAT